jgi:hypothetical protein
MMDRRAWLVCAAFAAVAPGCAPGPDSSQYKSYQQLQNDEPSSGQSATSIAADAPDGDPPLDAAVVPEEPATGGAAPVTDNSSTPAAPADSAAPLAAPTMKVVNGKVVVQTLPGGVRLLVPQASFRTEGPQGAIRVNYDDLDLLRILNMEPVSEDAVGYFPDWLKSLNGRKVRIRGFMVPGFEAAGLTQFVLARDTSACCFGPQAKLYYLIIVQLQPGKTTDYIPNHAFDVVGTFRIEMLADQGVPIGLYWIDDAQIIDR